MEGVIVDGFIVCSAGSERQVDAIADHLRVELKKNGETVKSTEGNKINQWILVDTCDIIVHIFLDKIRKFYRLEQLWAGAKNISLPDPVLPDKISE